MSDAAPLIAELGQLIQDHDVTPPDLPTLPAPATDEVSGNLLVEHVVAHRIAQPNAWDFGLDQLICDAEFRSLAAMWGHPVLIDVARSILDRLPRQLYARIDEQDFFPLWTAALDAMGANREDLARIGFYSGIDGLREKGHGMGDRREMSLRIDYCKTLFDNLVRLQGEIAADVEMRRIFGANPRLQPDPVPTAYARRPVMPRYAITTAVLREGKVVSESPAMLTLPELAQRCDTKPVHPLLASSQPDVALLPGIKSPSGEFVWPDVPHFLVLHVTPPPNTEPWSRAGLLAALWEAGVSRRWPLMILDGPGSHLFERETGRMIVGPHDYYVLLPIAAHVNAADAARALHLRARAAGLCWADADEAGNITIRTFFDAECVGPPLPAFVFGRHPGEGIEQRRPPPLVLRKWEPAPDWRDLMIDRRDLKKLEARAALRTFFARLAFAAKRSKAAAAPTDASSGSQA